VVRVACVACPPPAVAVPADPEPPPDPPPPPAEATTITATTAPASATGASQRAELEEGMPVARIRAGSAAKVPGEVAQALGLRTRGVGRRAAAGLMRADDAPRRR